MLLLSDTKNSELNPMNCHAKTIILTDKKKEMEKPPKKEGLP